MQKIVDPRIDPANRSRKAVSSLDDGTQPDDRSVFTNFWCSVMDNNARMVSGMTDCLLLQLSQNRQLLAEQLQMMSTINERTTSLMSHATVRAVAIATKAREKHNDRRVFTLPLPNERRLQAMIDRRKIDLDSNSLH